MKVGDQYWYRISGSKQIYYHRVEIVKMTCGEFGGIVTAKFLDDGRVERIYAPESRLKAIHPLEVLAECADDTPPKTFKVVPYQ